VISGLANFDAGLVAKVAKAAAQGGATHLDIACDPHLVRVAKKHAPHVPVCGLI
jgi:putative N-acetylmannosamine-6-phosphate epimerase